MVTRTPLEHTSPVKRAPESRADEGSGEQEAKSSIFDYRLRDSKPDQKVSSPPSRAVLNRPRSKKPQALERERSRPTASSRRPAETTDTRQKSLDLTTSPRRTTPSPLASAQPRKTESRKETRPQPQLSREILFSRFLAGIIDLTLPLALALVFTLAASRALGFDLFEGPTLRLILAFSATFFFFNSMFFLLSSGRTPGMHFTDLELRNLDGTRQVTPSLVLLRVLFFAPTVLSIFGLVWAIFDPSRRCLHDHLSGTQITPVRED